MYQFIAPVLMGSITHALRGGGHLPRVAVGSGIAGCIMGGWPLQHVPEAAFHFAAIWLGLQGGWGVYMRAAIDGVRWIEPEEPVTDWIMRKLGTDHIPPHSWGMWAMSVRFLFWFSPLIVLHGWHAAMLLALVGPIYFAAGRQHWMNPVRLAEIFTGALIGIISFI